MVPDDEPVSNVVTRKIGLNQSSPFGPKPGHETVPRRWVQDVRKRREDRCVCHASVSIMLMSRSFRSRVESEKSGLHRD